MADAHDPEHKRLREEIMLAMKANNVPVTGDVWFSLIFMPLANIRKMAAKLHIR